jgi:DNA-binding transcriptional LysR family regulator
MLDWSDLQYLLALARHGSLPRAAEALGVNRTTVSRRIGALEEALDARLVERAGRDLTLTQAGEEVVASAQGIEGEVAGLERRVFGRDHRLAGTIRLTTMSGMAQLIGAHLTRFTVAHPDIVLEIGVTNAVEDLENLEADVALRLTDSPPESLVGRPLATPRVALYGSPRTVASLPGRDSVPGYAMIFPQLSRLFDVGGDGVLEGILGAPLRIVLQANSIDVVRTAAAEGDGVALLPCYLAEGDPRLVRVGDPLDAALPTVWLLYHPRLRRIDRIRAFVEHVTAAFEELRGLIEGTTARG